MNGRKTRDRLQCNACGKTFQSPVAEAKHRHNFPALCTRNKMFEQFVKHHGKKPDQGSVAVRRDLP